MTKFKTMLLRAGMRQKELARLCGTNEKAISRAAVMGIKTARIAKRYAPYLGCDWRELLD